MYYLKLGNSHDLGVSQSDFFSGVSISVGVIGLNFKTAELHLREEVARTVQRLEGNKGLFFHPPSVILSTCNRTEIYFSAKDLAAAQSTFLTYLREQIEDSFEHHLYSYFGIDCFAHLCRVTAGLDSAIFAETEIQRQVKIAYTKTSGAEKLPGTLHYLFQKSLKVGKLIRNQLEQGASTLFARLWEVTCWQNKRILLVGYSEINRGFASYLQHKNIGNLSFCTTDPSLIQREGICFYNREILEKWQEFDLIVCASKADKYLITGIGTGAQIIFDLSVPRNVDPKVSKIGKLFNIDELSKGEIQSQNLDRCERLVWENVVKLSKIYRLKTQHARETEEMELHL